MVNAARVGNREGVARTQLLIPVPPQRVFSVLADPWSYSDWVVGTVHIRDADEAWPAPGSQLYHKAGPWPFSLRDSTRVLECEPDRRLVMKPKLWPLGAAIVAIELRPEGEHSTRVVLTEDFVEGPLRWVRSKINDLALHWRNRETLRRLADIAVRREADANRRTDTPTPHE
jgi:uncharacterized protein YndB with AHSA1/START domain